MTPTFIAYAERTYELRIKKYIYYVLMQDIIYDNVYHISLVVRRLEV